MVAPTDPFLAYGELRRFEAARGGLTASVNHRLPVAPGLGFIGEIDLPTDEGAADALIAEAGEWLVDRGCDRVQASLCRSTWYPFRVVTDGFDNFPRFSGEPWNARDLADRLIARGFEAVAHYESTWGGDSRRFLEAGRPRVERARDLGYRIRPFALSDLPFVHTVILDSFEAPANYLFHPIELTEFVATLQGPANGTLDPAFILLASAPDGSPAGFIYGTPEGEDVVSIKTLAVSRAHRSAGLGRALAALLHEAAAERGRPRLIHALMRTGNHSTNIDGAAGYETLRRYAIFERPLT